MNKKEYILALARLIKNRVVFHAPISLDEDLDYQILDIVGIDKSLPIFKFSKPMTKVLLSAFVKAQKEVKFNLVLTDEKLIKKSYTKRLKNLYFLDQENCPSSLLSVIDNLNINYLSHSAFLPSLNEHYLKINDEKVVLDFKQFYLYKKAQSNGVIYQIKEFVLNGKNYILNFSNPHSESLAIKFEINIPLPNGYYHFSKVKTGIKITNLTSKESGYFNFNSREGAFSFSCIDGLENSTCACVNLKIDLTLKPFQQKRFYFNFGDQSYMFFNMKQVQEFFEISQRKTFEIFDIKTSSKNKQFDVLFNETLPQKIWTSWSNFECDEEAERQYLALKNSVVQKTSNGYVINEELKGLKQVKIFSNGSFRHVFIVQGEQRFVMAEKTRFFNFSLISKDFFKQTNEIYLCFGK